MAAPYRHANCYDLAMAATILRNARRIIAVSALIGGALAITASSSEPQTKTAAPQASTAIGDQLMFDVASVKPNKSGNPPTFNFPLGPGDVYVPNGGFLSATNFPLGTYIAFAYKILGNQMQSLMAQLPEWVMTDRFDIQARAEGNPGKDQMRLMMRSLLADRFKLAIHTETREVPVLAFVLLKPGTTGAHLRPHASDSSCPTTALPPSAPGSAPTPSPSQTIAGGFPALCGGLFPLPPSVSGRLRFSARNVTITFMASSLSAGSGLGRPMVDQTGLSGTFDFTIEFALEDRRGPCHPVQITNLKPRDRHSKKL
jgi:uncharacterized protein (TIGR03435 family)